MFGYILPEKPELKIKEYELFRAYYCGLCKSIGKRHGQMLRLTLNYDLTFLALLMSSLANGKTTVSRERCIVHPLSLRHVIKNSEIIDYLSDMNILLTYYSLEDKWIDERSVAARVALHILRPFLRKIRKRYSEKCDIIESRLKELRRLEKERCPSMDMAAEPFARLMEEVLACEHICPVGEYGEALRWIGYNIGKWVYILDAYNDVGEDIKKSAYNVLLYQFNYDGEDVNIFRNRIRQRVEFNLTYALSQVAKAYELLRIKNNASLIENIIYMGMLRKTENILDMGSCRKIEKSV